MISAEATLGRVFVLRMEDGDRLPDTLEAFCADNGITRAFCSLLGGLGPGQLVVGPKDSHAQHIDPMLHGIDEAHEAVAFGTVFPDPEGRPKLHMHAALGREGETRTGCVRQGIDVWKIAECVVVEISGTEMLRKIDPAFGFEVLGTENG